MIQISHSAYQVTYTRPNVNSLALFDFQLQLHIWQQSHGTCCHLLF